MNELEKQQLRDSLKLFFRNLQGFINIKVESEKHNEARQKLEDLVLDCFAHINTAPGIKSSVIDSIIDSIDDLSEKEQKAIVLLKMEIEYYNLKCKGENKYSAKDGIENGKTVKDSIEDLFSLPEWVKKILKVLNEILSIVKTIV
ncbi:hypothetical protein [Pontibacter harenae]|uniref:hypothetical protein n=1 Tax=Pontibacter harenae TaxID=2894083 RepID=UPI001E52B76A|nr:hypothetical protein [Pontibacter harenae]MCC9167982.1 hypothetical protein [Pontibacter harenae]